MNTWLKKQMQTLLALFQKIKNWRINKLSHMKLAKGRQDDSFENKKDSEDLRAKSTNKPVADGASYFTQAQGWADDMYTNAVISRNRYKLAFFTSMGLCVLLAIAINGLIPLEHLSPLLVNHYQDGRVTVLPIKQPYAPINQAQTESELVKYVQARESFDATSYHAQFSLVNLMSASQVANQYINKQATNNKQAPINVLGNKGFRTVHIDSVVFLDAEKENKGKPKSEQVHHNLAQVDFTVTDHLKNSGTTKTKALTAVVSWGYRGLPAAPANRWRDFDGFIVTRYTTSERNS